MTAAADIAPGSSVQAGRPVRRGSLARRVVLCNLAGFCVLAAGLAPLTGLREALIEERAGSLSSMATMLVSASVVEGGDPRETLKRLVAQSPSGPIILQPRDISGSGGDGQAVVWATPGRGESPKQRFVVSQPLDSMGDLILAAPIADIEALVQAERRKVLQVLLVAALVFTGCGLLLASSILRPIGVLAAVAQSARNRHHAPRLRIPDAHRSDEIGELFDAMRMMVAALYDRMEGNERFAADVAHEIKNPLASLRSAVSTLRVMSRKEQREQLLSIIEHDVRRLDRLVSDISMSSRLDADLVREEEEAFDLVRMLHRLSGHLACQAREAGVIFVTDLPPVPIEICGLEARIAQVMINLVSNALSLSGPGDAIRVWCRRREQRVLIVVEDTGPGIPPEALERIFERFYSERPATQFGEHSGLGLAICRQIVEAHGGAIWAENVVPTEMDSDSEPMGARFVVGLPFASP